jgi:CHAD domain-containing protein
MRHERFARRIDKLLQRVRGKGEQRTGEQAYRPFRVWARERLRRLVEQFFAAVPSNGSEVSALHQLRIRGKQLRYGMELVVAAFPEEFRTELYAVTEAMQDRLGAINDLATAVARLAQEAFESSKNLSWRRLLANEQQRLAQSCQEFWAWCTPHLMQGLRDGFEVVLRPDACVSPDKESAALSERHG